jgi:hypothetical protein
MPVANSHHLLPGKTARRLRMLEENDVTHVVAIVRDA